MRLEKFLKENNKLYLSFKYPSHLFVLPIKEEIKNKIKLINGAAANNKTPD